MQIIANFVVMKMEGKSVFRRSAEGGVVIGVLFTLTLLTAMIFAFDPVMSYLCTIFGVLVPVALFYLMRKSYVADSCKTPYILLASTGSMMCVFGAIILICVTYVFLQFISPYFLENLLRDLSEYYSKLESPDAMEAAENYEQLADAGISSLDFSLNIFSLCIISGFMLSLIISLIIKFIKK